MTKLKTAKIAQAVCFELSCPDCGPEAQVVGPDESLYVTVEEFVVEGKLAYCIDCDSQLAMPRLPKSVRTQEGA